MAYLGPCYASRALRESSDAAQVHSMMTNLAQYTDIRVALVVGGLSLNVQAATLRTSPEVVVATPVSAMPQFPTMLERACNACPMFSTSIHSHS